MLYALHFSCFQNIMRYYLASELNNKKNILVNEISFSNLVQIKRKKLSLKFSTE